MERIERLREIGREKGMDYIVVIPGANMYYLTGHKMKTSERATILVVGTHSDDEDFVMLPFLESPQASQNLGGAFKLITWDDEEMATTGVKRLAAAVSLSGKRVGVEFTNMRVLESQLLHSVYENMELVDAEEAISVLRQRKDRQEIEYMKQACELSEESLRIVAESFIRPGVSELEIANQLKIQMFRLGSGPLPKEPIVSSGARTANPHTKTSSRKVEAGELIMIDTGATINGYASDITRTFALGEVDAEFSRIHDIVRDANAAAAAAVRPGALAQDIDRAARVVIDSSGYGKYFIHRLGHGVGLEGHEPPYMVEGNELVLEVGMTITDEPGIYLPGRGGIRVEDNVAVTEGGSEVLNGYSREWADLQIPLK